VIAIDTSVLVAGFASWHEGHKTAREILRERPRLPAHVAVEGYSVLTRLPPPHRVPASLIGTFLSEQFKEPLLLLTDAALRHLLGALPDMGVTGGSVYDAVVAATALEAGSELMTRDHRAVPTYATIGVSFRLLS